MSMTLDQLRSYVRDQTQTTSGELPNSTIDRYLQEAFDRTISMENQWPFFEETWTVTLTAGQTTATLPATANPPAIVSLFSVADKYRIELLPHSTATELYNDITNSSRFSKFSVWGGSIYFWPATERAADETFTLTGFRRATDWIASGPSTEPDCDARLHQPFAHYAVALAYAQQEDEQLEAVYMKRWQMDVSTARSAIMEPAQDRPLIMGPLNWRSVHRHGYAPQVSIDTTGLV